jgi:hypothetical protein
LAEPKVVNPVPPYPVPIVFPFHVALVIVAVPKLAVVLLKSYDAGRNACLLQVPATVLLTAKYTKLAAPPGIVSIGPDALSTTVKVPEESLSKINVVPTSNVVASGNWNVCVVEPSRF